VQATGLLEQGLLVAAQGRAVAGDRLGGEEAERIEVSAAQIVVLDDGIGARLPQPQRDRVTVLVCAVHHRPLVQSETAELPGA